MTAELAARLAEQGDQPDPLFDVNGLCIASEHGANVVTRLDPDIESKARGFALTGAATGPTFRALLDHIVRLEAELDRLEALALEQVRTKTLGGIPPVPDTTWGNQPSNVGVHTDYAHLAVES